MTAPEVITKTGEFVCWLADSAGRSLHVDLACTPRGYFESGMGVLALAFVVLLAVAHEARRRRNRPEGYL